MKTIHLTDAELAIVRSAVHSYLLTFGHNESDVVERVKVTLAKLDAADEDTEGPTELIG